MKDGTIVKWLLYVMVFINLLGVFAPEIGFDALWYHLVLPKLWLLEGRWFYPGGLLYYSAMPRLGETLFTPLLAVMGTLGPKLLQFLSGVGAGVITYRLALLYMDRKRAILAGGLFYITNIVSWQSGSGYIDLIRTFFEVMGVYLALSDKSKKWISKKKILAGVMLGLAIGTKWHALVTLLALGVLSTPVIIVVGLIVASPWMVIANHFTGNPMYPLFEKFMKDIQLSQVGVDFFSIKKIVERVVFLPREFVWPYDDYINPVFALFYFPIVYLGIRVAKIRQVFVLMILGIVLWQLTPPPSSRYFLPYLPYLAIVVAYFCRSALLRFLVICSFVLVIGVRFGKAVKFMPVIFGFESQESYLGSMAEKMPGTFVDIDLWGRANIGNDDLVFVEDVHNLYYVPGKFAHESWAGDVESYDYVISDGQSRYADKLAQLHINSLGIYFYQVKK